MKPRLKKKMLPLNAQTPDKHLNKRERNCAKPKNKKAATFCLSGDKLQLPGGHFYPLSFSIVLSFYKMAKQFFRGPLKKTMFELEYECANKRGRFYSDVTVKN